MTVQDATDRIRRIDWSRWLPVLIMLVGFVAGGAWWTGGIEAERRAFESRMLDRLADVDARVSTVEQEQRGMPATIQAAVDRMEGRASERLSNAMDAVDGRLTVLQTQLNRIESFLLNERMPPQLRDDL